MGIGEVLSEIRERGKRLSAQAAEQVSSHRTAVLCVAAGCGIIVLLLVVLVIVRLVPPKAPPAAGAGEAFAVRTLSPEDLFMLPEPDFVPEVLLEREPKDGWSEEDARQFWTDPLQGNEELWKRRIETGIDALLERIP